MSWQLVRTVLCLRQKFKYFNFFFLFSKRSCFVFVVSGVGGRGLVRVELCSGKAQDRTTSLQRLHTITAVYRTTFVRYNIGRYTYRWTYRYDRTVPDAVRTGLRNALNRLSTSSRRSELGGSGGGTSKVTVRRSSVHSHYRRRRVPKSAVYARPPRTLAIHSYRTQNQTVFYKNFFFLPRFFIHDRSHPGPFISSEHQRFSARTRRQQKQTFAGKMLWAHAKFAALLLCWCVCASADSAVSTLPSHESRSGYTGRLSPSRAALVHEQKGFRI